MTHTTHRHGVLAVLAMATATATSTAAGPAPAAEWCGPNEDRVFWCPAGRQTISVCAKSEPGQPRLLTYRYGRQAAGAFSLAATPGADLPSATLPDGDQARGAASGTARGTASGTAQLAARTLMFSGGGGAYLRFTTGAHDYVVFSAIGKGWGEKQGVAVVQGGKTTHFRRCTGKAVSSLGPSLFERMGIAEDPQEFVLPGR
jgi:hypothetical protein